MKTAHDLLIHGFKGRPVLVNALKLGETKIILNNTQHKILQEAIENKDYYEIKTIMKKLNQK